MKPTSTLLLIFILLFSLIIIEIESKKHGIKIKKPKHVKVHKPKPLHVHKVKHGHSHKAKHAHVHKAKLHKAHHGHKHVHHAGVHHSRPHHSKHKARKLVQPTTPLPLYSPPFIGTDNGQIPTVDQVALILDWLTKITSTIDVFLRLQATYPEGSQEQRQMVKNVFPPLKVLLAANYAHEYKTGQLTEDDNSK